VRGRGKRNLSEIRTRFGALLEAPGAIPEGIFTEEGAAKVRDELQPAIRQLSGSYYGMIEGIYPIHLISRRQIPIEFIRQHGVIQCAIHESDDEQMWAIEPLEVAENSANFFRLEFTIPEFIAEVLNTRAEERDTREVPRWLRIANLKANYMRFIDVTTVDAGQLIPFRLALDVEWLNLYIKGRRARDVGRKRRRVLMS
jgi:hypothetical protein